MTPVDKKLGIKEGSSVLLLGAPRGFAQRIADGPSKVRAHTSKRREVYDVVLAFVKTQREVDAVAKTAVAASGPPKGMLWFAYPKKSSGIESDLHRDQGWEALDKLGFGGVSLVALDETWSAARFRPLPEGSTRPKSMAEAMAQRKTPRPVPKHADDVVRALTKSKKAAAYYASLAPSHQREYIEWIEQAKKSETRARRIEQFIERLLAGKKNLSVK
jgi:hypothetical protein